ncbi:MAG: zinc-ribbon domain-containing protein [Halobacteriaceae archaeon]
MPYCPNCGEQVKSDYAYCQHCGFSLSEGNEITSEEFPSSWNAHSHQGFLSDRSLKYLHAILNENQEFETGTEGYQHLSRDVAAGLVDFCIVATVTDVNLLSLLLHQTSDDAVLKKNPRKMDSSERQERMMWMGFFRIPRLYDRTFDTEWADELKQKMQVRIEKAQSSK